MSFSLEPLQSILSSEKIKELSSIKDHPDVTQFPIKFTAHQLQLFKKAPELAIYFLPDKNEINDAGNTINNYGENENTIVQGFQHKYTSTALLVAWGNCATHCRACFRRYTKFDQIKPKDFPKVFTHIKEHKEINNVVISGGDPLLMPQNMLGMLLDNLSKIKHLDFIRIGSEVIASHPQILIKIKIPQLLKEYNKIKPIYLVTHIKHPVEAYDKATTQAIKKLQECQIKLLNQHMIQKNCNDNAKTLTKLYKRLTVLGVQPYYIFQQMPTKGCSKKATAIDATFNMLNKVKTNLSGIAKTFRYIIPTASGKLEVTDFDNKDNPKYIYLKYHHAKEAKNEGKLIKLPFEKGQTWIDESLLTKHSQKDKAKLNSQSSINPNA